MALQVFVGMHRPPWETFLPEMIGRAEDAIQGAYSVGRRIECTCDAVLTPFYSDGTLPRYQSVPACNKVAWKRVGGFRLDIPLLREHWQAGHFDTPVYQEPVTVDLKDLAETNLTDINQTMDARLSDISDRLDAIARKLSRRRMRRKVKSRFTGRISIPEF